MAALTSYKIAADGTYTIATPPGRYSLAVGGTGFGSGSLAVKWNDIDDNATAYATISPMTAAGLVEIVVPTEKGISLILTGATNPVITVALVRL